MMTIDEVVRGWRDLYEKSPFSVMIVDDIEWIEPPLNQVYSSTEHEYYNLRGIAEFAEQFNIAVIAIFQEDIAIEEYRSVSSVNTYSKNEITVMSKDIRLFPLQGVHPMGFKNGFISLVMYYSGFKHKKAALLLKMMKSNDLDGLKELFIRFKVGVEAEDPLPLEQVDFIWQYLYKRVTSVWARTTDSNKQ